MASIGGSRRRSEAAARLEGSPFLREVMTRSGGPVASHRLDPRTELAERNTAAVAAWSEARAVEVVDELRALAEACETALGGGDPDALVVRGNLAAVLAALGRWEEALPLLSTNLAARENVLGDEHPATLVARDALAAAHRLAGDVATAVALSARVAAQRTRVLGPLHRDTLLSRVGHLLALEAAGDAHDLTGGLLAVLAAVEQAHGADDPLAVLIRDQPALRGGRRSLAPEGPPPSSHPEVVG